MAEDLNSLFESAAPVEPEEDLGALFETAAPAEEAVAPVRDPEQGSGLTQDLFEVGVNPVGVGLRLLNRFAEDQPNVENPSLYENLVQTWKDSTRGAVQGATVGFGDEALAGLEARRAVQTQLLSRAKAWLAGEELPDDAKAGIAEVFGEKYQEERDLQRAVDRAAKERNPIAYTTGEVAGGVATSVGLFKGPVTLAKVAGEGAILGGVAGAGFSEAEDPEDILLDAALGAGVGLVAAPALVGGGKLAAAGGRRLREAFGDGGRKKAQRLFVNARSRWQAYQDELGLNPVEAANRAAADLRLSPAEFSKRALTDVKNLRPKSDGMTEKLNRETATIAKGLTNRHEGRKLRWIRSLHESVERVSPRVAGRLRRHEFGTQDAVRKGLLEGADEGSLNLLSRKNGRLESSDVHKAFRALPSRQQTALRLAMANGDEAGVTDVVTKAGQPLRDFVQQWRAKRGEYFSRIKQAGHEIDAVDGYYPRVFKSHEGLRDFYTSRGLPAAKVDGMLDDLHRTYGNDLPTVEVEKRAQALNSALRGRGEAVSLGPTAQMKARTRAGINTQDLDNMLDPFEAVVKYVSDVETNLSKRALFGLDETDVAGSLGAFVQSELDAGWVTPSEAGALRNLLQTRFINGERAVGAGAQRIRNATTAMLLGNFRSAATQLGDIAVTSGYHGARNTLRALFGPKLFDRYDLGVMDVAAEIQDARGSAKLTDKLLSWSGFKTIDGIGKNASINAAARKLHGWTKTPKGMARLREKYENSMTPEEFDQLVSALKPGEKFSKAAPAIRKEQNDLVRFALFSELSDTQPITLSELPVKFLEMQNGRLFYQMRTFTLKQMELIRKQFIQKMNRDPAEAMKFAARYGSATAFLTGGVEMLKDTMTGKFLEEDYDPFVEFGKNGMENLMMSSIGLNRFAAGRLFSGDLDGALTSLVMPASVSVGAGIGESVVRGKPEEAARYIPFIGPFYRFVTETK